ncbi:hypothetical protein ACH5RR_027543 [Cinchona calisaya]|uniref:MADS-box domain-containing protein n=1 Tax=Cinchona calisaya TaxID=153742 RepID=A0ABD2Z7L6_9GENT
METTVKKKGNGRKKIEIKKIEKKSNLQVTFSKRRAGLFKKAAELSVLCGVDVAVIVQSPAGNIFSSGGPSAIDSIIDRYLAATSQDGDRKNNMEIMKEIEVHEKVVKENKDLKGISKMGSEEFWWERRFDDLDVNELEEYIAAMEGLKKNVLAKVQELAARANAAPPPP